MEQLRNGYKKTDVGVIPEDWEVNNIGDVCSISVGRDLQEDIFSKNSDTNFPFPVYSNTVENSGLYGYYKNAEYNGDSLTIVGRGIGLGTTFPRSGGFGAIGRLLVLFPKNNFNNRFLAYYINNCIKVYEESGGIPQLTGVSISNYKVCYPPTLTEQKAIADALSDVDALIADLEKLIAKKKAIKQGAMQQLLTPKIGWNTSKLGVLCGRITTGKLDANSMNPNGTYRFYTCAKDFYYIDTYAFDNEALLVSGNGENVGYVHYYKGKFNAYQRTYVLTDFKSNVFYLKYYLDKYLPLRIEKEVNAGNTPYIKLDTLSEMQIGIPHSIEVQLEIANTLISMDREIQILEKKKEKIQYIKQGMMQELLTGKIRLI